MEFHGRLEIEGFNFGNPSDKKLEAEFGDELFLRDRTGCHLTAFGRVAEPRFRAIPRQSQMTTAEALRFTSLNNIPIRTRLMASIGAQRLSPFFARYQREYPHIELELIIGNEADLRSQLKSEALVLVFSEPTQLIGGTLSVGFTLPRALCCGIQSRTPY